MSTLLKYSGDIRSAIKTVNTMMKAEGYTHVTWCNKVTNIRYITEAKTVNEMYQEKFEKGSAPTGRVIEIASTGLTVNEIEETDGGTIIEGGINKRSATKIDMSKICLLKEVLYNENFDCSVLFD